MTKRSAKPEPRMTVAPPTRGKGGGETLGDRVAPADRTEMTTTEPQAPKPKE